MTDTPVFELQQVFKAPRAMVWRTWTEKDLLARWYGPGVETVIHELNPVPGGLWLNEMRMGGNSMFQRTEYTEVAAPERLIMLMSTSDADWNIIDNPMMANWPRVLLTEVLFEEADGKTTMTLRWSPHEATTEENTAFQQAINDLGKGWGAGMESLVAVLEELQA